MPRYLPPTDGELAYDNAHATDLTFTRWTSRNVRTHKMPGYASVVLSTRPSTSAPPGDITAEQMERVTDWTKRYGFGEIHVVHEQNLMFPGVYLGNLHTLWYEACVAGLGTPSQGLLSDIVACPGGDYCTLVNARSVPITQGIQRCSEGLGHLHDTDELSLSISSCTNACSHHHIGSIGILGVDKNGSEWYQITLGNTQDKDSALSKVIGPSSSAAEMPAVIEWIVETFTDLRVGSECSIDTLSRVGLELFKARVYARMKEPA